MARYFDLAVFTIGLAAFGWQLARWAGTIGPDEDFDALVTFLRERTVY